MHGLLKHVLVRPYSVLRGNDRGRRNLELGMLTRKERVFREFHDEFVKLSPGDFRLFLAQSRQRQHNLSKRPKVVAMSGGDLDLLDSRSFIAADSGEAEEKLLEYWLATNNVIRHAQAKVGIGGVGGDSQQFPRVGIRLADHF